jgi:hypothetical protein
MSLRVQAIALLAGLTAGGALAAGGAADGALPVITVNYRVDCTFTITIGGVTVDTTSAPGVTVPPGPYQVQLLTQLPGAPFDPPPGGCVLPAFSLSGPGASWTSNLADGELYADQATVTLQPSSTYDAVDGNHATETLRVFSTTATGSSSSLLVPGSSPTAGPPTAATQQSLVGSSIVPFRGALHVTVAASGKATLESGGKSVDALDAGRYDFVVRDRSGRGGFFVQKAGKKAIAVTTVAFEGSRTVRVYLSAGAWTFFTKVGEPTRFVVR